MMKNLQHLHKYIRHEPNAQSLNSTEETHLLTIGLGYLKIRYLETRSLREIFLDFKTRAEDFV